MTSQHNCAANGSEYRYKGNGCEQMGNSVLVKFWQFHFFPFLGNLNLSVKEWLTDCQLFKKLDARLWVLLAAGGRGRHGFAGINLVVLNDQKDDNRSPQRQSDAD